MRPCPICGLEGGFHDSDDKNSKHAEHQVPRELLKESGWAKEAHAELKRERAEKEAERIAALEAELGVEVVIVEDEEVELEVCGAPA